MYVQLSTDRKSIEKIVHLPKGGFAFQDGTSTGSVGLYTDEALAKHGIFPVYDNVLPIDYDTQKYEGESLVLEKNGKVTFTRLVVDKTQREINIDRDNALSALRQKRDALLAASDFALLPDVPLTTAQVAKWKTYRQALRDLPSTLQNTHPVDAVFPVKPI